MTFKNINVLEHSLITHLSIVQGY